MNRLFRYHRFGVLIITLTLWDISARADEATNIVSAARAFSSPSPAANQRGTTNVWQVPPIKIASVQFENLQLYQIGLQMNQMFTNAFDTVLPNAAIQQIRISLTLKDVTAEEVFNAMNLVFESSDLPIRWELTMNGHRPTAVLRDLSRHTPSPIDPSTGLPSKPQPAPELKTMVYYVGDLMGDPKTGGMGLNQIRAFVSQVTQIPAADDSAANPATATSQILVHEETELLIVKGTSNEIAFVAQTLEALKEKVRADRAKALATASKTPETKAH